MITEWLKKLYFHSFLYRIELLNQISEKLGKRKRINFIKDIFPMEGIGAELGVYKGHLSPLLHKYTKAKKLHLIDPWYLYGKQWDWGGGNRSTVAALIRILKLFKKEIGNGEVFLHIGNDLDVLRDFQDDYFDWVYIDSSHKYEHTLKELTLLKEKIKDSGIIAGDDWIPDPRHRHHGVYRAVNEFVNKNDYEIVYSNQEDRQWAISKQNILK